DQHGMPVPSSAQVSFFEGEQPLLIERGLSSRTSSLELRDGRGLAQGLPAAVVRVVVELRGQEPQELDLDLRVQPREPVQMVVELQAETQIGLLFVGTGSRDPLPEQGEQHPYEWLGSLLSSGDVWLLDEDLSARFRAASGSTLATAEVRPGAEG